MYINQHYCSGRFHWTGGNVVGSRSFCHVELTHLAFVMAAQKSE